MKTILIAASPAATTVISTALGPSARMMTAHTIPEALSVAATGVDLIIAGIYFDESRVFDLLHMLKSDVRTQNIPVLCVRGVTAPQAFGAETDQPMLTSSRVVESATKALGAAGFIDLCIRQRELGVQQASDEFALTVRSHLQTAA